MALSQITRVHGKLRCYGRYECRKCGGTQVGESFEVQVDTHDASSILGPNITPRAHSMPVGWASFCGSNGTTVFQCSTCNNESTS